MIAVFLRNCSASWLGREPFRGPLATARISALPASYLSFDWRSSGAHEGVLQVGELVRRDRVSTWSYA